MPRPKEILTTGEVARICNVAPRTVSKWFDNGQLRGYRIPGSKDRRIPMPNLVKFMQEHGIPLGTLQKGGTRVLIVDDKSDTLDVLKKVLVEQAHYEVALAHSGFEAGASCGSFTPHVMLLNLHLDDVRPEAIVRMVRSNDDLAMTKLVAVSNKLTEGQAKQLLTQGFDGYLKKPFHARQVIETIEDATAIVY